MGKQGPCYHCGVTSTPLWRNGPPEKPVLCNACGSRWRTKGSLTNYTPLHARADLIESEVFKCAKLKTVSFKPKEPKLQKRKNPGGNAEVEDEAPNSDRSFRKIMEEDVSNRSSSGSAISYSESCAPFGYIDGGDYTGSAQSTVWESLVPSRKRTCINRPKPSSVEKLTKDLYSILHEQQQQSSYMSGSSEEDLLFESGTPMDSFEIGHGGVLIKHLISATRDEESEASSFPVDNKVQSTVEVYSGSIRSKGMSVSGVGHEKFKKPAVQCMQESTKRDKILHDKLQFLRSSSSPLRFLNLRDVVSFEEFVRNLTHDEQQQLMKLLPSVDMALFPDSLKGMFESPQFLETISTFQQLLLEGAFDLSMSGVNAEECRTLKRLALVNSTKSKWVERYQQIKDAKHKKNGEANIAASGSTITGCGNVLLAKRSCYVENQSDPEANAALKSPRRGLKGPVLPPAKSPHLSHETKDMNEGSRFCPRSLFTIPPDRSSCMLDSLQFTDESSEQELLFDVPSNACFPQAELLDCNLWKANSSENSC